jgi:hypothetical protein
MVERVSRHRHLPNPVCHSPLSSLVDQSPEMPPTSTKALVIRKRDPVDGQVWHDAVLEERPLPELAQGQVLVRIVAAGFNRRDVSCPLQSQVVYVPAPTYVKG